MGVVSGGGYDIIHMSDSCPGEDSVGYIDGWATECTEALDMEDDFSDGTAPQTMLAIKPRTSMLAPFRDVNLGRVNCLLSFEAYQ